MFTVTIARYCLAYWLPVGLGYSFSQVALRGRSMLWWVHWLQRLLPWALTMTVVRVSESTEWFCWSVVLTGMGGS